ncbi:MAG: class II aldolase/adducin family protein, partial [Candidatus Eremiobacteraeota bacterium]|nr:class II aldolase/adducin family protein [Candidatus Eremiobacteraeota bacterium]
MSGAPERDALVRAGAYLATRGLAPGTSGNISLRLESGYLLTPTNSSLGSLDPSRLARLNEAGETVEGDPPTKEAALHLAMYRVRTDARAVVHMHAPHSVALSC